MKKIFGFLVAFLSILPTCFGQEVDASVQSSLGEPIITSFEEPKHLFSCNVMADGERLLFVRQTNWGKLIIELYDTQTGQLLFTESSYRQGAQVTSNQDYLLLYEPGYALNCYNVRTAKMCWHNDNGATPFWINDDHLLVRKPKQAAIQSYGNEYRYIDLKLGLTEWINYMDLKDGINYVQEMEDRSLFFSTSEDLIHLDVKTGQIDLLPCKTHVVSGKKLAGNIGIGVALGAAMVATVGMAAANGYYFYAYPTYYGKRYSTSSGRLLTGNNFSSYALTHVNSQVLEYQNRYYMADSKQLYCVDENLGTVWTKPFPKHRASNSYLYQLGDTLVVANHGAAYLGGTKSREMGRPFLAGYRMQDGELLFYRELSDKKEIHLQNGVDAGCVWSRTNDKMYCLSLPDTAIQTIRWDTTQYGAIRYVAEEINSYVIDAENYRFDSLATGLNCVVSNRNEAYRASVTEDPELVASRSCLYRLIGVLKDDVCCIVGGIDGKDCWVIRRSGEPVYHFMEPIDIVSIKPSAILYKKDKTIYVAKF